MVDKAELREHARKLEKHIRTYGGGHTETTLRHDITRGAGKPYGSK